MKLHQWLRSIIPLAKLMLAFAPATFAADNQTATPVSPSQAQFGGQCAEGLAEGRHVMTNCSITWTDKDGKIYCFKSEAAKAAFLKGPAESLERARSFVAAGNVLSTEQAMQNFEGADAETLVKSQIDATVATNGGVYPFEDALTGEHLKLAFDGVDFTRTIDGYGFFPDVKFHDQKDPNKKYLIDFWVAPEGSQLQLPGTRIYQALRQVDGKWQAIGRSAEPVQSSSRLRSIQAVFSCTSRRCVNRSAVGWSFADSSSGKSLRAVRAVASWAATRYRTMLLEFGTPSTSLIDVSLTNCLYVPGAGWPSARMRSAIKSSAFHCSVYWAMNIWCRLLKSRPVTFQ